MSPRRPPASRDARELFELLAGLLAPHLRQHLSPQAEARVAYYDQSTSPLGKRRHLELVRRGVLNGRKTGRRILVGRDEVHAFIDGQKSKRGTGGDDAEELLADWSLARGSRA